MNTGIGDRDQFWPEAGGGACRGMPPDRLLGSCEAERIGFAGGMVTTTDRVFSLCHRRGPDRRIIRTRVAPRADSHPP